MVAALGVPAGTYNVVANEPLTKREYADALSVAAGKAAWLRVPGSAALLLGNRPLVFHRPQLPPRTTLESPRAH